MVPTHLARVPRQSQALATTLRDVTLTGDLSDLCSPSSNWVRGLHAGGYAFQIETTYRARLAGARIVERPITFEERREGESKMTSAIFVEAFRVVLALRLATLCSRRNRIVRDGC